MVLLAVAGIFLFCGTHLLLMRSIRLSQAEIFAATQRNGVLLGERRAYLVAVEQQKAIFTDIVLEGRLTTRPDVESNPFKGEIRWPIFFDEKKTVPFGLLIFHYNPWMYSQWMIIAFSFAMCGTYYAVSRSMQRAYRERLKDEALRNSQSLTTSIQMIAHDVRKPLATTQRFLSLLAEADHGERSDIIEKFRPVLVRSLDDVTKLLYDAGAGIPPALDKELLDLSDLVQQAVASGIGGRKDREVGVAVQKGIRLLGDRRALIRALHNLLDNACKESREGGEIWVRAEQEKNKNIRIVVGNSGSFIPEAERERIFDTFYTRSTKGGQGLGLSVVKKVVDAHGGMIHVVSSVSEGTEFVLIFPHEDLVVPQEGKILVIDDCPLILFQWRRLLGSRVITVESPEEFRALCESNLNAVQDASYAVVDYYFAEILDGEAIASVLNSMGFKGKVLFASDAPEGGIPVHLTRIPKDPSEAVNYVTANSAVV